MIKDVNKGLKQLNKINPNKKPIDKFLAKVSPDVMKQKEFSQNLFATYGNEALPYIYDSEILLDAIKNDINLLKNVPDSLKNNADFMAKACAIDNNALKYASGELRNNNKFMQTMSKNFRSCDDFFELVGADLKNSQSFMSEMIISDQFGTAPVGWLSDVLKNNRNFIEDLLKRTKNAEVIAKDSILRNDKSMLRSALCYDQNAGRIIPKDLRNDKDFMLGLVDLENKYYKKSERFLDRDHTTTSNQILDYVSEDLRNNREFLLEAIDKNGANIDITTDLMGDRELILESIRHGNAKATRNIYDSDLADKDFLMDVLEAGFQSSRFFNLDDIKKNHNKVLDWGEREDGRPEILSDPDFILEAVDKLKNPFPLAYVSDETLHNRDFVLKLVGKVGSIYKDLPEEFKQDKEIVKVAVNKSPLVFHMLPEEFKKDPEIFETFNNNKRGLYNPTFTNKEKPAEQGKQNDESEME